MKQCDFLLTYEIRNREIESICLIKHELERRGYNVQVCEQYRTFFETPKPVDAKVVVIPAYYRPRARYYTSSHVREASKIVNMQWEQISTESRSQKGGLASIKEWGFDAMHLSWGYDNRERLTKVYGVPEEHVTLTGHVAMDFLRPRLRGYFLSREELLKMYNIPEDKEVCLFISSFVLTDITDRVYEKAAANEKERDTMAAYRIESQKSHAMILEWFEKMLQDHPERILIYRPHPEEKNVAVLEKLQEKYENFRVIREQSVRQWILVADQVLTWLSTSIAEVYFAGRECIVLQPVEFSKQTTLRLYEHVSAVRTYEEFDAALRTSGKAFPVPQEDMDHFYWRSEEKLSYELVCDAMEKVLKDDALSLSKPLKNPFAGLLSADRIKNFIKRRVAASKICAGIRAKDKLKGTTLRKNIDDIFYVKEKLKKNHVTKAEFAEIEARIARALGEDQA